MSFLFITPLALALAAPPILHEAIFRLERPAEVVATVVAGCPRCDWGVKGREAAVLSLAVDGVESRSLVLFRGEGSSEYRVLLGPLPSGQHRLTVTRDLDRSARGIGSARVDRVVIETVTEGEAAYESLAHAPILRTRRGSLERFSDLPLLTWVETVPVEDGRELRYAVVFSNEDGGTPPDRLMATWGRVTDIELVYVVALDRQGRVARESYQGNGHVMQTFLGRKEGDHPVLHVVTENNMVSDRGPQTARLAPAPIPFALEGVAREAVMDAHPWTYQVSGQEVRREGRVRAGARPGSKRIPDPREFIYLEACGVLSDARLAFDVGVRTDDGGRRWVASDAGRVAFRIARSGCFRSAIALPHEMHPSVEGLRVRAYTRPPERGKRRLPAGSGRARLDRVSRLFTLDEGDQPLPSRGSWTGPIDLPVDAGATTIEMGSDPRLPRQ